jgi:hypothetical protein
MSLGENSFKNLYEHINVLGTWHHVLAIDDETGNSGDLHVECMLQIASHVFDAFASF